MASAGKVICLNQLVLFVNLFFVPALTVYLFYKCRNESLLPSLELLFQYCAAVCGNLVLTKFLLYFLRTVVSLSPSMDSALYTLIAMVSACLLAVLGLIGKRLQIEIQVSRIEEANETHSEEDAH